MQVVRFFGVLVGILAVSASASGAEKVPACRDLANEIVHTATSDVLKEAVSKSPALQKLSDEQLVLAAGKTFLTADRPDFKAYGYMMLLWYGGQPGRDLVAKIGPELETEKDRAHYYFVLGLHQLRSTKQKTAATGRDYIRQMRDSGQVGFVTDAMWDELIEQCRLP